ncbi:MAG: ABC transporter substrate-binding protein [Candidatus Eremiobacteraeota bacterium]|nr:ABC transporter substrate-binding protein [Candidatus Eremiobacteraeota bacterium]
MLLAAASACTQAALRAPHVHGAQRIVSLVPSLTEDLFALGAGARVVAVTQADDYPPQVKRLPAVASFSSVNNEAIVRLHPDAVVGIPAQERLTAALRSAGIPTTFLRDDTYEDIFADINALGGITQLREAARNLIEALHAKTNRLQRSLATANGRPRVLFVVNVRPIIVAGRRSFISTLLTLSGAENATDVTLAYPSLSAEAVLQAKPDAIVTDDQTQLTAVLATPPWSSLTAVRRHRIYVLDKAHADVVERPGPRYNDGIAWLIARLRHLR